MKGERLQSYQKKGPPSCLSHKTLPGQRHHPPPQGTRAAPTPSSPQPRQVSAHIRQASSSALGLLHQASRLSPVPHTLPPGMAVQACTPKAETPPHPGLCAPLCCLAVIRGTAQGGSASSPWTIASAAPPRDCLGLRHFSCGLPADTLQVTSSPSPLQPPLTPPALLQGGHSCPPRASPARLPGVDPITPSPGHGGPQFSTHCPPNACVLQPLLSSEPSRAASSAPTIPGPQLPPAQGTESGGINVCLGLRGCVWTQSYRSGHFPLVLSAGARALRRGPWKVPQPRLGHTPSPLGHSPPEPRGPAL